MAIRTPKYAEAGTNAWRKVEGMTGDRRISRKLKGKVLTFELPRYTYIA